MKLMGDLNRVGVYPELEHEVQREEGKDFRGRAFEGVMTFAPVIVKGPLNVPRDFPLHLDLFLKERMVDFEIDGKSHKHRQAKDAERDEYLLSIGIKPVHLTNHVALHHGEEIAAIIGAMM
jgi:hypothetical protein